MLRRFSITSRGWSRYIQLQSVRLYSLVLACQIIRMKLIVSTGARIQVISYGLFGITLPILTIILRAKSAGHRLLVMSINASA